MSYICKYLQTCPIQCKTAIGDSAHYYPMEGSLSISSVPEICSNEPVAKKLEEL